MVVICPRCRRGGAAGIPKREGICIIESGDEFVLQCRDCLWYWTHDAEWLGGSTACEGCDVRVSGDVIDEDGCPMCRNKEDV